MVTITAAEAQENLIGLLDTAQREPVSITRDGQPAAFLVSAQEMEEVLERRRRQEAVAAFEAWTVMAREHRNPAAEELTDEDIVRMVHEER